MAIKRSSKLSTLRRKMAYDAIDMCVNKFIPRLREKVTVRVVGVPDLLDNEGVYADCDIEDYAENPLPRSFLIRIDDNLPLETFISTLMHEMVHVKQYAKGEMKLLVRAPGMTYRWKGERIQSKSKGYYDLPWEIEAHGREMGLFELFKVVHPKWLEYFSADEQTRLPVNNPKQLNLKF